MGAAGRVNSRERVLRSIRFEKPDRLPIYQTCSGDVIEKYGQAFLDLMANYPDDLPSVIDLSKFGGPPGPTRKTDQWGIVWEKGLPVDFPLKDWGAWPCYAFPPLPPMEGPDFDSEQAQVAEMKAAYFTRGSLNSLWQHYQALRGYENAMMDLYDPDCPAMEVLDAIVDRNLALIERNARLGHDCVGIMDDWGLQDRLMIAPVKWREIFKPRYRRMFAAAHEAGMYVFFHSDGCNWEIADDLVEIGVTIFNPQFEGNDLEALSKACRGKIAILSDVDRQHLMPRGTREEIRAYVKRIVGLFATPDGGMILQAAPNADTPLENFKHVFDAFVEFGRL
jgi:hypothetical protein